MGTLFYSSRIIISPWLLFSLFTQKDMWGGEEATVKKIREGAHVQVSDILSRLQEEKKLAVLEKDLAEWNTARARSALNDEEKLKCHPGLYSAFTLLAAPLLCVATSSL